MKEAEHLRGKELVKRTETHPHRAALHADLQQNNVYNPFSKDSKEMIRELSNVELFEWCETTSKVQCSQCLLYWNQGIVYCTCGQCLIYSESRKSLTNYDWICTLHPELRDKERRYSWCSTRQDRGTKRIPLGMECVEEMLQESRLRKVNILQVFTIGFSEIQFIVNRNSQSDGQNQSVKSGVNLRKKIIHINSLQKKGEDTKDTGILL